MSTGKEEVAFDLETNRIRGHALARKKGEGLPNDHKKNQPRIAASLHKSIGGIENGQEVVGAVVVEKPTMLLQELLDILHGLQSRVNGLDRLGALRVVVVYQNAQICL